MSATNRPTDYVAVLLMKMMPVCLNESWINPKLLFLLLLFLILIHQAIKSMTEDSNISLQRNGF